MSNKTYFTILVLLIIMSVSIAFVFNGNKGLYWIWATAGLVIYIWCKDAFTGTKWLGTPRQNSHLVSNTTKEQDQQMVSDYLPISTREKEGYLELTQLCVSKLNQPKLFDFFENLRDFSKDEIHMSTLNVVMEYLDENNIHFIMSLDWKAAIEDIEWRLNASLQDNFNLSLELPKQGSDEKKASVSFHHVFEDFDAILRKEGLQMGFINTESDEYVVIVHKVADKERVKQAVEKIGYAYAEK